MTSVSTEGTMTSVSTEGTVANVATERSVSTVTAKGAAERASEGSSRAAVVGNAIVTGWGWGWAIRIAYTGVRYTVRRGWWSSISIEWCSKQLSHVSGIRNYVLI